MTSTAAAYAVDGGLGALADTEVARYLEPLGRLHRVLCPRQVLGVRIALLAEQSLSLRFPQTDKRTSILAEIDGCFTDGLMVVSNCSVGHRTLSVADLGKIAATFVDTRERRAVRIWPRPGVRATACAFAARAPSRWHAQRLGYARMPAADLLAMTEVPIPDVVMRALVEPSAERVQCVRCGEEVFNARHVVVGGQELCRPCASELSRHA
jgi:formylmethanofuran dehydrogenase subunit E